MFLRRLATVTAVVAVAVSTACSHPVIGVVVAPLSGAPSPATTERTERFTHAGVDYTVTIAVVYHQEQLAQIDATLRTASGDAAPQGAPLTLQEIDYVDPAAAGGAIMATCFDTVEQGRQHASDRSAAVRCHHDFVVRYVVPGATASPSPVGPRLTARVVVSDAGAAAYDPTAVRPAGAVHTFGYVFA